MVECEYSRLCFKADEIEPLKENDSFIIKTPQGTFKFTKADFYREFSNVIKTKSYQEGRLYHYPTTPKRALQFLISDQSVVYKQPEKRMPKLDLVGEGIRMKIKEIGTLWRNSPNNPPLDIEVLRNWDHLIDEWIDDDTMPLIIRKETRKKGQAFTHPCGREIIVSDNTVAIWVFSNVLRGKVFTLDEIRELLKHNELPIMFASTKENKEKAKYTKCLDKHSLPGWKVCHIQPIGFNTKKGITDLDISVIKEHFKKYVNPNNMFVLPKEIGDLGEIDEFIEQQKQ